MYIRATESISPQLSFGNEGLLADLQVYEANRLSCLEPDYKSLIDPKQIRRMSRVIKMGVASALGCLKKADVEVPDAIITGTAYGCLEDTSSFLTKLVNQNEEMLTPTAFIQSTHNTIGAQIALLLKCHNYNNTYVHRGFSFENALLDAILLLKEQSAENVLVGGVDELTDTSFQILNRFGFFKQAFTNELYNAPSKGSIAGEGASFVLLANQPGNNDNAVLEAVSTFYKPATIEESQEKINRFLLDNDLSPNDIDVVITGRNGDETNDVVYDQLMSGMFRNKTEVCFKHLCGEYPTASSFALWMAASIIKKQKVDKKLIHHGEDVIPQRILIYNHSQGIHHSLMLISGC
ncbi:beta-ketoacyl synthase [Solitalea longa]|uniref:Beta-ketoacyl synthase n=1 Tax=Solitalea longa TaxID=2079460 RepID=A0A2S5A2G8_9SPHI|nr:beta-ketoacyl synthase [Solitalea longa]